MRVFLTGGTGLLGSHLAELLLREGHEVVALCRGGGDTRFLETSGCEIRTGDVRDRAEALAPSVDGCSHVVHSAALVYAGDAWPHVRDVNVLGTRNVLDAAAMAGVGHAVHVSSVAVYGRADGVVDEDTPTDGPVPAKDLYARSKREAEHEARSVEAERGLPVTVVRPSAVYGERDRLMAPRIARLMSARVSLVLGSGDNTLPTVYAGNVADAILRTMEAGAGGAVYDVGLDHPLTQRQLLEGIAAGLGWSIRIIPIPKKLVLGVADVLQTLGIPTPGAKHLPVGRVARLAVGENPYPSRRIRERLGWDPPHHHDEALQRTGLWLKDHM